MEWYRRVQFVSAVPMPPEMVEEFGTTVNGMWAEPELGSPEAVTRAASKGRAGPVLGPADRARAEGI